MKSCGRQYDYGARFYDPVIGRFNVVDALSDHPNQIDKSPYAYGWNNPVNLRDPDGNCPICPIIWAVVEGISIYEAAVGTAAVITTAVVINNGRNYINNNRYSLQRDDYTSSGIDYSKAVVKSSNSSKSSDKKGDTPENPEATSRAARRGAMRKAGVPTSQPLHKDKDTKSEDAVLLDRDGNHTVQDAKNDESHKGQPHWEAGKTKKDPTKPDGLNRSGNGRSQTNKPRMEQPKGKVYYKP
ncbi:RHS repeat-associated core domain-containing protein [Pedobacter sp. AK013]|uniref:RHS repeat-associated core domain-containing protein n=1 Tax=Pedobacter sp. AK013 TaxID=2723071 RepID=UPI0021037DC6|nr:RHS repeat-associated core domain-containing protein [Pedobacter sp. AK013]